MNTTTAILALKSSVKSLDKAENTVTLQGMTALAKQLTFQVKYHWDTLEEEDRAVLKDVISTTLKTELGLREKMLSYASGMFFAFRFRQELHMFGDYLATFRELQEAVLEKIEQESPTYQQMIQERLGDSAVVQGETRGTMNGSQAKRRLRELI